MGQGAHVERKGPASREPAPVSGPLCTTRGPENVNNSWVLRSPGVSAATNDLESAGGER